MNVLVGFAGEISNSEIKTIDDAVTAANEWLEKNTDATFEELTASKKKLKDIVDPIISKLYQKQGSRGGPGSGGDEL